MMLEDAKNCHRPRNPRRGGEGHRPQHHVCVQRRVPDELPGHHGQRYVGPHRPLGRNLAWWNGRLTDDVPPIVEHGVAGVVAEAGVVGVGGDDVKDEGDVEVDG